MSSVPFGGWTPTHDFDLCAGGHPGGSYTDPFTLLPCCYRCGRLLDLSPCNCQEHKDHPIGRSYCPTRIAKDKRSLRLNAHWLKCF